MNKPQIPVLFRIRWTAILGVILVIVALVLIFKGEDLQVAWSQRATAIYAPAKNPLQADRAMGYLKEVCAIGPRISATPGMLKQQELIKAHFEKLGAKVSLQEFPSNGIPIKRTASCSAAITTPAPSLTATPTSRNAKTPSSALTTAAAASLCSWKWGTTWLASKANTEWISSSSTARN
jgi:hypothetical protein